MINKKEKEEVKSQYSSFKKDRKIDYQNEFLDEKNNKITSKNLPIPKMRVLHVSERMKKAYEIIKNGYNQNYDGNNKEFPYNTSDMYEEEFLHLEIRLICQKYGFDESHASDAVRVIRGEAQAVSKQAPEASSENQKAFSKATKTKNSAVNLSWPKETYSEAHNLRGLDIVQFLSDNYRDLIKAGLVTRVSLAKHDPTAANAVANYLRGKKRTLPEGLHIPTVQEINNTELTPDKVREAWRIAGRAARRPGMLKS